MNRAITGFQLDDQGDWVAELTCGHRQHVRHRPPFQVRPWVLDLETRRSKVGSSLSCPLCDRAELPDGLQLVETTPRWDEYTTPAGLQRLHRLDQGTWGRIRVHRGRLRFTSRGQVVIDVLVDSSATQAIPSGLEHSLQMIGPVCFSIDFFSIDYGGVEDPTEYESALPGLNQQATIAASDVGGETACWAHLVCTECGGVLDDVAHAHERPKDRD